MDKNVNAGISGLLSKIVGLAGMVSSTQDDGGTGLCKELACLIIAASLRCWIVFNKFGLNSEHPMECGCKSYIPSSLFKTWQTIKKVKTVNSSNGVGL